MAVPSGFLQGNYFDGITYNFLHGTGLSLTLKLDSYRVLVLDDLGYVKRDDGETSLLFELIAHRYERRSLIVTSNHPFSRWGEIFTDKSMAVAAADRLIHHCYLFELQGESYRKKTTNLLNNPSFN